MTHLKTKHVFIDTSIFYNSGFAFNGKLLQKLAETAVRDTVSLYITDITKNEVHANIKEVVAEALRSLKKFKNDGKIFRNLQDSTTVNLFQKDYLQDAEAILQAQFESYIQEAKISIISTESVSIKRLFEFYFNNQPPFGLGKKKSEFPDAVALFALEKWCIDNNQKIYVISSDGDMINACKESEKLISVQSLSEFFDILSSENDYLHLLVVDSLKNNSAFLKELVKENFNHAEFLLEDQDGDVLGVTVNDIEIEDGLVVDVDQDSATVNATAKISFSAEVQYKDLDNAIWDREERKYIFWDVIKKNLDRTEKISVDVILGRSEEGKQEYYIYAIMTDTNRDIPISVDLWRDWENC